MENLTRRITKELQRHSSKNGNLRPDVLKKLNLQKMQLYSDYEIWIENLKTSMHLCKYRKVITEIEARKHYFDLIEELHWKYQYIEIDAIFKLLKKKILTHSQDIAKEGSHHQRSCFFWFNQIYIILEQLLLELRPDLNKKLDYNNEDMVKPVQCILDSIIKFCFLLLLFAQINQQLPDMLSYLSIIDKIIPFMRFTNKGSSYIYIQKIQLFKVKILTENCEFITAVTTLEGNIDFCLDYIQLFSDDDYNAYVFDLKDEQRLKYQEYLNKRRLFKMFLDSGFKRESAMREEDNLKLKNKNKEKLIALNAKKIKNMENLNINNIISPKRKSKAKKVSTLELKKASSNNLNITNITNTSLKNDSNNNNTNKNNTKTDKKQKKKTKTKKINSNNQQNPITDETKKKNLFLTQIRPVKTLKQMNKGKKRIIDEILNNIALNFYLRGAIFEHVGNIDSALDSYKEVEWFAIKFLINKFPKLAKYMISLLKCAWNNYNVIYKLKTEKEKRRQRNEIIKIIELKKKKEKLEAQKRHNDELIPFKSIQLYNNKKLNNFLNNLGNKIYKEEEQRNFNVYNKFSKTGYILSTYKTIGNLLSDDLRPVLKHMKKVELTKPTEEIKDLIDKALIKKQQKESVKEDNKSANFNMNNIINTKMSSMNVKESSSFDNKKKEIFPINQTNSNFMNLKKKNKRSEDKIIINRQIVNSSKKFSASCEMGNNFRNINIINLYEDSNKIFNKRIYLRKSRLIESNLSSQRYQNYKNNKSEILKINPGISSTFRTRVKKEKVQRYLVDKDNFSKNIIKKKIYLDSFSSKEFLFLRDLLKSKSLFPEVVKPIDDLELKKVRQDADINFYTKLEIAKSGRGKKNLNNLINQNINIVVNANNQKSKTSRTNFHKNKSYSNFADISDNNEKLKKLENDCKNINSRRRLIIKRKKEINSTFI